jgi:hypothetical protein
MTPLCNLCGLFTAEHPADTRECFRLTDFFFFGEGGYSVCWSPTLKNRRHALDIVAFWAMVRYVWYSRRLARFLIKTFFPLSWLKLSPEDEVSQDHIQNFHRCRISNLSTSCYRTRPQDDMPTSGKSNVMGFITGFCILLRVILNYK